MRPLALLALASFSALAVAACGTAPGTESSSTTDQDLTPCLGGCFRPSICNYVVPPAGSWTYIQSWSVASPDGTCPDIPGPNGTWKNLQPTPHGEFGFDGVPCEVADYLTPFTCSSLSQFAGQPCCTYVWWPNGFVAPSPWEEQSSEGLPQPACAEKAPSEPLCTRNGATFYANAAGGACAASVGGWCHGGGGSVCTACSY